MAPLRRKSSEEKQAAEAEQAQSTFDFEQTSGNDVTEAEVAVESVDAENPAEEQADVAGAEGGSAEEPQAAGEAGKVVVRRKRIVKKTEDNGEKADDHNNFTSYRNGSNYKKNDGFKKGGMPRRPFTPRTSYGTSSYPSPSGEVAPEIAAASASAAEAGEDNAGRPSLLINDLTLKSMPELRELATQYGFTADDLAPMKKQDLIFVILKAHTEHGGIIFASGALEILPDGYGFLRSPQARSVCSTLKPVIQFTDRPVLQKKGSVSLLFFALKKSTMTSLVLHRPAFLLKTLHRFIQMKSFVLKLFQQKFQHVLLTSLLQSEKVSVF